MSEDIDSAIIGAGPYELSVGALNSFGPLLHFPTVPRLRRTGWRAVCRESGASNGGRESLPQDR